MKAELRYSGDGISQNTIMLEQNSHESVYRAERASGASGLAIAVFSYSEVLAQVTEGEDPIETCAKTTGTPVEQQLKGIFVSDAPVDGKHNPNTATVALRYPDRVDFRKVAAVISANPGPRSKRPVSQLEILSLDRLGSGYLAINPDPLLVPMLVIPGPNEGFDKSYTDRFLSMYIVDESLRCLPRFCMLAGCAPADALVVVDGRNGPLGDKLDAFFKSYFAGKHAIADIREKRK